MRNTFICLCLFIGCLLFDSGKEPNNSDKVYQETEAFVIEKCPDIAHSIEILSKDLKSNNFLVPRRHVQTVNQQNNIRIIQLAFRILYGSRLKKEAMLFKTSSETTQCITFNLDSLLCRRGYHIYALRKLII